MDDARVARPWALAGLPKETPVLLAYSGGADSTALLGLLRRFSEEDGFPLTLAHVNHGIRGADALRDRDFCVERAREAGLDICVLDADVPASAAENGRGLEEEARETRYAFFARVMREKNIPILVTAHHADDNAETVLFRLSRGTGLQGLCGIAPVRKFADGFLVRPLLAVGKNELLQYCIENRLPFVTDGTNGDTQYARNRLRHEVMPVLDSLFPGVAKRIGGMSEALRQDEDCLSSMAEAVLDGQREPGLLPVRALTGLHPAIRRRVLRLFLLRETGTEPLGGILDGAAALLNDAEKNCRMTLSGRAVLSVENGILRVFGAEAFCTQTWRKPLAVGTFSVGEITVTVTEPTDGDPAVDAVVCTEDEKNCCWRPAEPGDRILLCGMHKRLVQLWREAGVPTAARRLLPVLTDGEEILFAPFAGVRKTGGKKKYGISVSLPARDCPADEAQKNNQRG